MTEETFNDPESFESVSVMADMKPVESSIPVMQNQAPVDESFESVQLGDVAPKEDTFESVTPFAPTGGITAPVSAQAPVGNMESFESVPVIPENESFDAVASFGSPQAETFKPLVTSEPLPQTPVETDKKIGLIEKIKLEQEAQTGKEEPVLSTIIKSIMPMPTGGLSQTQDLALKDIIEGKKTTLFKGDVPFKELPDWELEQQAQIAGISMPVINDAIDDWDKLTGAKIKDNTQRKQARVDFVRTLATEQLRDQLQRKQDAGRQLDQREQTLWAKLGGGFLQNAGYTLSYMISPKYAAMNSGVSRLAKLMQDQYALKGEQGELVKTGEGDTGMKAFSKAATGAALETIIEQKGGDLLGSIGTGLFKRIPGGKKVLGLLSKVPVVGSSIEKFKQLGKLTGKQDLAGELFEEILQGLTDNGLGLDMTGSEKKALDMTTGQRLKEEALSWVAISEGQGEDRKLKLDLSKSVDTMLGMLLQQVIQGGAVAVPEFNKYMSEKGRMEGFLQTVGVDPKEIKKMSHEDKMLSVGLLNEQLTPEVAQKILDRVGKRSEAVATRLETLNNFGIDAGETDQEVIRSKKFDVLEDILKRVAGGVDVKVFDTEDNMLAEMPELSETRGYEKGIPGVYYKGTVGLVLDNLTSPLDAVQTILHESNVHADLSQNFTPEEKMKMLRSLGGVTFNRIKKEIEKEYGSDSAVTLEETLARMRENSGANPNAYQRAITTVRRKLREIRPDLKLNNSEIEVLFADAQRRMSEGEGGEISRVEAPPVAETAVPAEEFQITPETPVVEAPAAPQEAPVEEETSAVAPQEAPQGVEEAVPPPIPPAAPEGTEVPPESITRAAERYMAGEEAIGEPRLANIGDTEEARRKVRLMQEETEGERIKRARAELQEASKGVDLNATLDKIRTGQATNGEEQYRVRQEFRRLSQIADETNDLEDIKNAMEMARLYKNARSLTGETLGAGIDQYMTPLERWEEAYDIARFMPTSRGGIAKKIEKIERKLKKLRPLSDQGQDVFLRKADPIDSPAFKAWFGDSKVVDAEGKPLVVYHGTRNLFNVFDRDKGIHNDAGWLGVGFYFYGVKDQAEQYVKDGGRLMEVYLSIQNPYYATYEEMERLAEADDPELSQQFTDDLMEDGYDGVYFNGDLRQEWVSFSPTQIKSATDNVGTFDPTNPDIRFRKKKAPLTEQEKLKLELGRLEGIVAETNKKIVDKLKITPERLKQIKDDYASGSMIGRYNAESLLREIVARKSGFFDKAYEYWISSILSGPQTGIANFTGNTANQIWNLGVLRFIEATINSSTKWSKDAAQFGEFKYMGRALKQGWGRSLKMFMDSYLMEMPAFMEEMGQTRESTKGRTFESIGASMGSKKIGTTKKGMDIYIGGKQLRIPLRLLLAFDEMSKTMSWYAETAAIAYREGKKRGIPEGKQMQAYIDSQLADRNSYAAQVGLDTAKRLAFQSEMSQTAEGVSTRIGKTPFRWLVPFRRTPVNILKTGLRETPLGMVNLLKKAKDPTVSDSDKMRLLAEQAVAFGVTAFFAQLILGGDDDDIPVITGSSSPTLGDRAMRELERRNMDAPGPQSIRIGDNWYSYSRIEPWATALTPIVDSVMELKKVLKDGKEPDKALTDLTQKVIKSTVDKTFTRSIGDLYRVLDDPSYSINYVANFGTSFIPNIIKQPARATDPYIRETRVGSGEGKMERLGNRIVYNAFPTGQDGQIMPMVTPWGEDVKKPVWGKTPATDVLFRLLSPMQLTTPEGRNEKAVKLDRLITNYNNQHPNNVYAPKVPERKLTIDGSTVTLTDQEYYDYVKMAGEEALSLARVPEKWIDKPRNADIEDIKFAQSEGAAYAKEEMYDRLRDTFDYRADYEFAKSRAEDTEFAKRKEYWQSRADKAEAKLREAESKERKR